jgi:hypothetical protein
LKTKYLIAGIVSILFIGCSSTYNLSDFSSKEKFYTHFNNSAKDKSLKVVLTNDSLYNFENGVEIKNDTLYSLGKNIPTQNKKVGRSDVKEINFTDGFYTSALILLKDGEEYQANDIKIYSDSIYFSYNKILTIEVISSLNKIKNISYKAHWAGVPGKLFLGAAMGASFGAFMGFVVSKINHANYGPENEHDGFIIGTIVGFIAGGIIGWINGNTYTYEFSIAGGNP